MLSAVSETQNCRCSCRWAFSALSPNTMEQQIMIRMLHITSQGCLLDCGHILFHTHSHNFHCPLACSFYRSTKNVDMRWSAGQNLHRLFAMLSVDLQKWPQRMPWLCAAMQPIKTVRGMPHERSREHLGITNTVSCGLCTPSSLSNSEQECGRNMTCAPPK